MDKREFMQALYIAIASKPGVVIGSVKASWCAEVYDAIESHCAPIEAPDSYGENAGPHGEDEDWIEWGGGVCPVAPESARVDVKLRNAEVWRSVNPHEYVWCHPANPGASEFDIVAYRVVSE